MRYELYYWPIIQGRGEFVRLALEDAGADYVDMARLPQGSGGGEATLLKWMDEPGPTDVMSFPMDELDTARRPDEAGPGPALLGDVVLCPAVASDQATQAGHSLDDELHLLTVHGCLHLLGYDHAEPAEEREMFRLQNELLDTWRDHRSALARRARLAEVDAAVLDTVGLGDAGQPAPGVDSSGRG